jgi:heat shock protein HslJ
MSMGEKEMNKLGHTLIMLILVGVIALTASHTPPNPTADLVGSSWKLVSFGAAGHPTPAVANVDTTLTFGRDGKVSGNLGCNSFSGDYTVGAGMIDFGQLKSTVMTCEKARMEQESNAFQLMTGAVRYKIDGSSLVIYAAIGDVVLSFHQK